MSRRSFVAVGHQSPIGEAMATQMRIGVLTPKQYNSDQSMPTSTRSRNLLFVFGASVALVFFVAGIGCRSDVDVPSMQNTPINVDEADPFDVTNKSWEVLNRGDRDDIVLAAINFTQYFELEDVPSIIDDVGVSVQIFGFTFRPKSKNLTFTTSLEPPVTVTSNWLDVFRSESRRIGEAYRMTLGGTEVFSETAYQDYANARIIVGSVWVSAPRKDLVALWANSKHIRFISPGKGDLFPPIIISPDKPLGDIQ